MKKFLLSLMAFFAMSTTAVFAETATLNFVDWNFDGADAWGSSYEEHVVTFDVATVTFAKANKQTNQAINDCPVTKGNDVTVMLNDINIYNITGVTVTLKQWNTKKQTASLQYSTDGTVFADTETSSDNFYLEDNALPAGTKALKVTFSSQSNQVGIAQIVLTYESASGEVVVPAPTFSIKGGVYYEAQEVALSATEGAKIYYTTNGDEPTTSSIEYTAPIEVATTTTIKAIAVLDGVESEVAEATYTITNLFHGANFEEGICGYTFQDVELGDGLTYIWTLDEEWGYLKASAFVSGSNIAGESWAVSPEIDLTKAETAELQLTEAVNFLRGEDLERYCMIKISKNYIDNVNTADWTQLEATNRPAGDSWSECTIDPVDLAEFVGNKVRLAFCYVSTTNAAPTWEIFNVNITGEIGGSVSVDAVAAEEGAKAIGGNGEIVIVGEASNVEVYNIAGALVEEGNLTNIPCATGIYVVKVDGKAQKVIVK